MPLNLPAVAQNPLRDGSLRVTITSYTDRNGSIIMATGYSQPHYLTDVETLQQTLGETDLRLFDTAVFLTPKSTGGYRIDSGYQNYQSEHIPGAGFIDLISDWSDTSSTLNFTLPWRVRKSGPP